MAERVFAAAPAAGKTVTARGKTPPKTDMREDAREREADRTADAVVDGRQLTRPDTPPPLVAVSRKRREDDLNLGRGRALDPATRSFMETGFGYDFSQVRIHADDRAARSAASLHALAYASGTNIVFARNAYDPHSRAGRHLLAHELAHVAQQSSWPAALDVIQCKPEPKPAPPVRWYQEVINRVDLADRRMAEDRKSGGLVFPPPYYDNAKALLALCEAVDRKAKDEVPKKLDKVLELGLWVHLQILSRDLLTELSARMHEMGLEAETDKLRKAYAEGEKFGPYGDDMYAARRKVDFYTRLVSGAINSAKYDVPEAVTRSIHQFTRTFVVLRDEYGAIDWEALNWEMRSSRVMVLRPYMSREEFYRAILGQIERWQAGLSTLIQQAMDAARRDLESSSPTGSGAALLKALREAMVGELKEALFPKDEKKNIAGEAFQITKTTIGKGSGSIGDAFPEDRLTSKRRVPITTYDPEQEYVRELRASIARFYRVRIEQLDVLGRIYGVLDALTPEKTFAETMKKAEEAKDNAQTLRNMTSGRLRLDSDDDWRVFLLQKYNELVRPPTPVPSAQQGGAVAPATPSTTKKAATPAEALHTLIDLLFDYLRAFTVHARFTNLYDIGDTNYLNRPFPRALTGQLVHDCGVYALRVAYMLSLVRKELKLRFRFVVLPAHVSLVITGDPLPTGDKLPTFVVENDHFEEWSAEAWEEERKKWQQFKEPSTGTAPADPADEEQFVGEAAAAGFIAGPVDMPFRVTDVPPPLADAKAEQRRLWAYYQGAATAGLFGPSSQRKGDPNYLFHQRYLALTEESRQIHNETVLPFWNKAAPDAWNAFQQKLTAKLGPGGDIDVDDLLNPLGEYKSDFEEALKSVKTRLGRFNEDQRRLSERLRSDPNLKKAGVRFSAGLRATTIWDWHWDTHAERIKNYENDLVGRPIGAKEPIKTVEDNLKPFFVPPNEKKLEPLD